MSIEGHWVLATVDDEPTRFFPPPSLRLTKRRIAVTSGCNEWHWKREERASSISVGEPIPIISCDRGLDEDAERLMEIMHSDPTMTEADGKLLVEGSSGSVQFIRQHS